jgi:hypothetical protein
MWRLSVLYLLFLFCIDNACELIRHEIDRLITFRSIKCHLLLQIGTTGTTLSIRVKWAAAQGFLILGGSTVSALVPLHKLFKTISIYISVFVDGSMLQ